MLILTNWEDMSASTEKSTLADHHLLKSECVKKNKETCKIIILILDLKILLNVSTYVKKPCSHVCFHV